MRNVIYIEAMKVKSIGLIGLYFWLVPVLSHAAFSDGVEAARNQEYREAVNHFMALKGTPEYSSPSAKMRLATWLGVSQLGAKVDQQGAMDSLQEALCIGLVEDYRSLAGISCFAPLQLQSLDAGEQDLLAAAVVVYASEQWDEENYDGSMALFNVANTILLTTPVADKPAPSASGSASSTGTRSLREIADKLSQQDQQTQQQMMNIALSSAGDKKAYLEAMANSPAIQQMQENALKKGLATQVLQLKCQKMDQAMVDTVLTSMVQKGAINDPIFVEEITRLAKQPMDVNDCSARSRPSTRRTKAKYNNAFSGDSIKAFHLVAQREMCLDELSQENLLATAQTHMAEVASSAIEAKRGNRLTAYSLARPPFLKAYRNYASSGAQLKANQNEYRERGKYIVRVLKCGDRQLATSKMYTGIISALNRGTESIEYYEEVLQTLILVQQQGEKSTIGFASQMLRAHSLLADKYLQAGQKQKAIAELNKSLAIIQEKPAADNELNMLAWLRALTQLSENDADNSATRQNILNALNTIQTKHSELADKALKLASMDFDERMAHMMDDTLESGKVQQAVNNIDVNKVADATLADMGMQLPPEMMKEMRDHLGDISKQLNDMFEPENFKRQMNQNVPQVVEQLKNSMTNPVGRDINGTMVEMRRNANNDIRMFELGVAEIYIALGDQPMAKSWLDRTDMAARANEYSPKTLAFNAYVNAKYAQAINDKAKATNYYASAVDYWYFNPIGVFDLLDATFPNQAYLLEKAAKHAIDINNTAAALRYIEIARNANIGNSKLYGYLNPAELHQMQVSVERTYKTLQEKARQQAIAQGQQGKFKLALQDGEQRRSESTRNIISPLMPLYTGLDPILNWIDTTDLHAFASDIEKFNDLWSNQNLTAYRKQMLVDEKNKLASETEMVPDAHSEQDADFLAFRSAKATGEQTSYNPDLTTFQNVKKVDLLGLTDVQTKLKDDVSVVSLWLTQEQLFLFHLTKAKAEAKLLPISVITADIESLLTTYNDTAAGRLYKNILAGFSQPLQKRVVLVVNGSLQNIPFVALKESSTGQYLGDEHLISYSPSIDDIFSNTLTANKSAKKMLVLAPTNVDSQQQLAGANQEANNLKQKFKADLYLDADVTPALLQKEAPKYRLIHFAGHASLNRELPDFSRLILAKDSDTEKSSFYIDDIKALNLTNTDLVVLSACESASNNTFNISNEFSTISAAFMNAGAKSVVASLHRVNDEVAVTVMDKFYEALADGQPKDTALQIAQRYVRETISPDPYDWAAFIVSGRVDPVEIFAE